MSRVKDGILGLVVGDALGVPVEFNSKEKMKKNPVVGMREYGTHNQPAGTWPDDSSMTLALMDSLCGGVNYYDMMERFCAWAWEGFYTATGKRFDIGNTTAKALLNYKERKYEPLECGGVREGENGNGSLMRILPIVLYAAPEKVLSEEKRAAQSAEKATSLSMDEKMELIHNVSSLTHAHRRSLMGCGIYAHIVWKILDRRESGELLDTVQEGMDAAFAYYGEKKEFEGTAKIYQKMQDVRTLADRGEEEIWGAGYVVATLEAALWSLVTTTSYQECVLKAVNLGNDTDTVAAVAGSLAGLWYGMEQIPDEWMEVTARRKWILGLCEKFENSLA